MPTTLPRELALSTLSVARTLLEDVGGALMAMAREGAATASEKPGVDLVTAADRFSEATITAEIARAFPQHRVLAEEGTVLGPADSPWTWHLDPLDGTANFHRGLAHWAISLGLSHGEEPVLGVIHGPACGVLVYGAVGLGAWSGETALPAASPAPEPRQWLVATDWPWDLRERRRTARFIDALSEVVRQYKTFGSAAVDLALLAQGRIDAYATSHIFRWDQCAGAAVLRTLGYDLRTWRGERWDLAHRDILACRPGCAAVLGPILAAL
jgi:myo-inositol-1(or 4)-monophosphatase